MSGLVLDDHSNVTVNIEGNVTIKAEFYYCGDSKSNIPLSDFIPDEQGNVVEFCAGETRLIKPEPIEGGPSESGNTIGIGPNVRRGKSLVCPECDRMFSSNIDLNRHINDVHLNLKTFKCGECDHAFTTQGDLDTAHKTLKKYSCGELNTHYCKMKMSEKILDDDSNVTVELEDVAIKTEVDYVDTDSSITLSDFIPDERGNMLQFEESETQMIKPSKPIEVEPSGSCNIGCNAKSHVCPMCSRAFSRRGNLKLHISVIHLKIKKYLCGECGHAFGKQGHLNRHLNSIHRKLKYACGECDRAFTDKGNVKKHVYNVHRKLKYFKCNECDRAFTNQENIKRHLDSVHRKLKKYSCGECGRDFSGTQSLKRHLDVIHRKLKKYICEECDFAFTQQGHLKIHVDNIHRKIIKFQCGKCARSFSRKQSLQVHLDVVHMTLKNYLCAECKRNFGDRRTLIRHLKNIHHA